MRRHMAHPMAIECHMSWGACVCIPGPVRLRLNDRGESTCWEAMKADCGTSEESCGEAWDIVDAMAAVEGEGDEIWCISFSLRKHLASTWSRQEQKSHLGQFWDFLAFWSDVEGNEEVADGDVAGDDFGKGLCDAGSAENAVDVPDSLERVWSMFRSNWITDYLSNLSRTEMVLTTSSKEWGSTLMMAMTASSS